MLLSSKGKWFALPTNQWIFLLQILGIGNVVPPNTHDWSLYITPEELNGFNFRIEGDEIAVDAFPVGVFNAKSPDGCTFVKNN